MGGGIIFKRWSIASVLLATPCHLPDLSLVFESRKSYIHAFCILFDTANLPHITPLSAEASQTDILPSDSRNTILRVVSRTTSLLTGRRGMIDVLP